MQNINFMINSLMRARNENGVAIRAKYSIGVLGHQQVLAAVFVLTFDDSLGFFVVDVHIVDFAAVEATDFLGTHSVDEVGLAVPAESFFGVLVFAFGADADGAVRSFDDDWIQEFFFGEIVVEAFALFSSSLGIKLIFKHRIRVRTLTAAGGSRCSPIPSLAICVVAKVVSRLSAAKLRGVVIIIIIIASFSQLQLVCSQLSHPIQRSLLLPSSRLLVIWLLILLSRSLSTSSLLLLLLRFPRCDHLLLPLEQLLSLLGLLLEHF